MASLAVKEGKLSGTQKAEGGIGSGEVMAFCPLCKAFQTICIESDVLVPTRKFFQVGSLIYHDCGSIQPCRLYDGW